MDTNVMIVYFNLLSPHRPHHQPQQHLWYHLYGHCVPLVRRVLACRWRDGWGTDTHPAPQLHHFSTIVMSVYLNIYSCTVLSMQVSSLIAGQGACFGSENRPNGCCDGQVAVVDGSNWSIINYHWLQHYLYCYLVIYRLQSTVYTPTTYSSPLQSGYLIYPLRRTSCRNHILGWLINGLIHQ